MATVFVRGGDSMPPLEELVAIEGVYLVNNDVPGGLGGTPSNYACLIGEFADCGQSIRVDVNGAVQPSYRPDFAINQADLVQKFGGFDSTLGQFGNAMGNGYVAIAGKVFGAARLICLPIINCSAYAGRMWRQLPTNQAATLAEPIVPLQAATIPAGYEFKSGNNRVRTSKRFVFTGDGYKSNGTDGAVTATMSAATQNFVAASGDFTGATTPSRRVYEGDLLVLGVIGGAGALGANADTYRVVSVTNATTLVVQKLTGANFDWTTGTAQPWRVHPAAAGDTGQDHQLSEVAGYLVPARPLDATILAAQVLSPTLVPPTPSGTVWDPLSGLRFATHPSQPLTYTAAVQAPNAPNSTELDVLYQAALNGLLGDTEPNSLIGGVACARKSSNIAAYLRQHVLTSFGGGHMRIAFIAPALSVSTYSQVVAPTYPGVEALRSKYVNYYWPGLKQLPLSEAVGTSVATADGGTTTDGVLDVPADEFALALYSRLPPENNPGQASEPVPSTFAVISGYARNITPPDLGTFKLLKERGVCAFKVDRPPAQIQSAVNTLARRTALDPATAQNQVAMTQFIAGSLAEIAKPYSKELATQLNIDGLTGDIITFLTSLGPKGSGFTPERIKGFNVSRISTPEEEELGVYKFKVDVKMLASMDYIVFSITCGPNVELQVDVE